MYVSIIYKKKIIIKKKDQPCFSENFFKANHIFIFRFLYCALILVWNIDLFWYGFFLSVNLNTISVWKPFLIISLILKPVECK